MKERRLGEVAVIRDVDAKVWSKIGRRQLGAAQAESIAGPKFVKANSVC